jgi:hypothetical protein
MPAHGVDRLVAPFLAHVTDVLRRNGATMGASRGLRWRLSGLVGHDSDVEVSSRAISHEASGAAAMRTAVKSVSIVPCLVNKESH